jgi:hypothetical protein
MAAAPQTLNLPTMALPPLPAATERCLNYTRHRGEL